MAQTQIPTGSGGLRPGPQAGTDGRKSGWPKQGHILKKTKWGGSFMCQRGDKVRTRKERSFRVRYGPQLPTPLPGHPESRLEGVPGGPKVARQSGKGPACSPLGGWGPEPAMAPEAESVYAAVARPPTAAQAASSWRVLAWPGQPTVGAGSWVQGALGLQPLPAAVVAASAVAPVASPEPERE